MSGRVRLGELLVTGQIITREQLEQVLAAQQHDGRKLGQLLVERGLVTENQLTQILSQQLAIPWVSLYHIDFSRQLLDLVPRELAEKYCLVPIFVRRVRGLGETLYVAMNDPTDEAAVRAVSDFAGLPVRTMIAPPSDIRGAIRAYYTGSSAPAPDSEFPVEVSVSAAPPSQPEPEVPIAPVAAEPAPEVMTLEASDIAPAVAAPPAKTQRAVLIAQPTPPPFEAVVVPKPAQIPPAPETVPPKADTVPPAPETAPLKADTVPPSSDSSPTIEAREVSMPAPRRRPSGRMVTLTFLDGTRVNLPARSAPPTADAPEETGSTLTARDMVTALRAVTHGADAREILGEKARWEPLFAALLELLLKKHLIADWEFVEAFNRIASPSKPPAR